MAEVWWLLLAAFFSTAGMAWLALSMDVHWRQAVGNKAGNRGTSAGVYRILGGSGLALSLGCTLLADHPSMAVLVWFMLLAASAFCVAMLVTWRPQWLLWLAIGSRPAAVKAPLTTSG